MFKMSFLANIRCSLVCSKYAMISGACCTTLLWLSYLMLFIHPWNTTCSNIFLFETNHGYSSVFSQALKFSLIFCVTFSLFLPSNIPLCPLIYISIAVSLSAFSSLTVSVCLSPYLSLSLAVFVCFSRQENRVSFNYPSYKTWILLCLLLGHAEYTLPRMVFILDGCSFHVAHE